MQWKPWLGAALLALAVGAPALADDRPGERPANAPPEKMKNADDDEKDVLDEIEKTLRSIPEQLEKALGELQKQAPEKARELEEKARAAIEDLLRSVRGRSEEQVHVRVGDREMDVPASVKNGKAKVY